MTREEAIYYLTWLRCDAIDDADSHKCEALNMAIDALEEEPKTKVIAQINVDADEVVKLIEQNCNWKQPRGHWILKHIETTPKFVEDWFCCSECGKRQIYGMPNYCPNCGADMRRTKDD